MKFITFLILILAFNLAYAQVWTVEQEELIKGPTPSPGLQQIPLQLYMDGQSEWAKPGELKAQIDKVSGILRQCGLEIGDVKVKHVTFAASVINTLNNPNPYKGPGELILTQGELEKLRPVVFLFGKDLRKGAWAFSRTSIERLSNGSPVDVKPLLHITLLSGHYRINKEVVGSDESYNNLAHELAHILGDLDHIPESNNLMSSLDKPKSKTGGLNATQCEKIRQYSKTNFGSKVLKF